MQCVPINIVGWEPICNVRVIALKVSNWVSFYLQIQSLLLFRMIVWDFLDRFLVSPPSCMNDWQMQFYVWTLMMQLNNETQEYAYLLVRYQEMKESWYLIYYIGIRDTLCGLSRWWKSGAHTISRDERRLIYAGLSIGMIITIFILFNLLSPLNNTNISPTTKLLPTSPFSSPQNCQNK